MSGVLEPTNDAYALAKICGIKLCDYYREQGLNYYSVMLTNLYGPNDRYDVEKSHVIPAMILKFLKAKEEQLPSVVLWGDGSPLREFLHVDDLSQAILNTLQNKSEFGMINVGSGIEISIKNLAYTIQKIIGYDGEIIFDTNKPNGVERKLMDSNIIRSLGWQPKISLEQGLNKILS